MKSHAEDTCKGYGIWLIVAGVIAFLLPEILSTSFGIFAILLGVTALVFRKKWVIALIGAVIILVGTWNICVTLLFETLDFFILLGIIQIIIGVSILNEYHKMK